MTFDDYTAAVQSRVAANAAREAENDAEAADVEQKALADARGYVRRLGMGSTAGEARGA